jgi:hypothetical protein
MVMTDSKSRAEASMEERNAFKRFRRELQRRDQFLVVSAVVGSAIVLWGSWFLKKGLGGLAEGGLGLLGNLVAAAVAALLVRLFAMPRLRANFSKVFGESVMRENVTLFFSTRTLPSATLFKYPAAEDKAKDFPVLKRLLDRNEPVQPTDVAAWLAHEDVSPLATLGAKIGSSSKPGPRDFATTGLPAGCHV